MRRIKLILFLFLFCIGIQPALAEGRDLLFEETFEKVVGTSDHWKKCVDIVVQ